MRSVKKSLRQSVGYGFISCRQTGERVFFLPGLWGTLAWGVIVNRKRMHIYYSGNVQGVGFRYTVKSIATGFEVTGAVRNLPDGRVELLAEGAPPELEAFRQAIRDGGLDHFIRDEDLCWSQAENEFRGFEIAR